MVRGDSVRSGGAVNAREWRVMGLGSGVLVLAALLTFVVVPMFSRWELRSARRDALSARVTQLQSLIVREASLQQRASSRELALALSGRRVVHAPSMSLAASALQSLLQDAADASQLLVDRVEVPLNGALETPGAASTEAVPSTAATSLTATVSVTGDVIGLAALLDMLQRGPRALQVERMTVQINPSLRGATDVLQATLGVRAPLVITP